MAGAPVSSTIIRVGGWMLETPPVVEIAVVVVETLLVVVVVSCGEVTTSMVGQPCRLVATVGWATGTSFSVALSLRPT